MFGETNKSNKGLVDISQALLLYIDIDTLNDFQNNMTGIICYDCIISESIKREECLSLT